ncbi:MAG: CHAT domain-containing protein [Phycisphaerales bacterium]|nr:CHAT domain-containing protein [Phycisphaerales bacterium]
MNRDVATISLADLLAVPAEQRTSAEFVGGLNEESVRRLGDEAERMAFSDVTTALSATLAVIELADALGAAGAQARARRARAQALAYSGQHEPALAMCAEAERVAREGGAVVEAARAKLASLHPLGETGRYEEAIAVGEAARAALIDAGEPALAARADINLGAIYQNRDDPARALTHLERARRALGAEPNLLAFVENNRGEALLLLSDFDGAEEAFLAARAAADEAGAGVVAAVAEGNLADLAARRGLLSRSMNHFERARRRLRDVAAESHAARLQAEHAEALEALGMVEDAAALFEEALPALERHGMTAELARALHGLALCHLRTGQPEPARDELSRAREAFVSLGARQSIARVDLTRAELFTGTGDYVAATDALSELDDLGERPFERVITAFRRSQLSLGQGDAEAAERYATEAVDGATSLSLAPLLADALHARAAARRAMGRADEAFSDLRCAATKLEPVRGSLQAERFRASALGKRSRLYEDLVGAAIESAAPPEQVFWSVEHAKGRVLLDLAARAIDAVTEDDADGEGATLTRSAARLRAELNALYSRRADALLRGTRLASADRATEAIRIREAELSQIETRQAASRGPSTVYAAPCSSDEAQAQIHSGEALIEFFRHSDQIGAMVVTRDGAQVMSRLVSADQVASWSQRLRFQLNSAARIAASGADPQAGGVRETLGRLYDMLLSQPLSAVGGVTRLVVVPHGALHTLPIHASHDGSCWLIERYECAYAPSASLFAQLRRRQAGDTSGAVVVGVADEHAPCIEDEARRVAECVPGARTLLGSAATQAAVSSAVHGARWIHLGCHGSFSPDRPQASGLRLADGWLTPREIARLNLDADMVVLSACSSGETTVEAGDELTGLSRSFFAAGARSVIASLWPAHDAATRGLMDVFYRELIGGASRAAALRAGQSAILQEYAHPLYWGTFALVGAP